MVIAGGAKSVPGTVTVAETGSLAYASNSWTVTGTPFASSTATIVSIAAFSPGLPDGRTCSVIAADQAIRLSVVIAALTDCARASCSAVVGAVAGAVHAAGQRRTSAADRTGFDAVRPFLILLTPERDGSADGYGSLPGGCQQSSRRLVSTSWVTCQPASDLYSSKASVPQCEKTSSR